MSNNPTDINPGDMGYYNYGASKYKPWPQQWFMISKVIDDEYPDYWRITLLITEIDYSYKIIPGLYLRKGVENPDGQLQPGNIFDN